MRGIHNDVDRSFKGKLEVIDVSESKRAFCNVLGCERCLKTEISVGDKSFGVVYPEAISGEYQNVVSMVNVYNNPEFLGSFILFGITDKGKLTSLTVEEVNFLLQSFSYAEYEDGKGKFWLWHVN